jgi:nitrite reductase/ring-hydroxylating ferredoxin subunit
MLLQALGSVTDLIGKSTESQAHWLDSLGEQLQQATTAAFASGGQTGKKVEDFLHGSWYGHALHPALILAPAGAWVTAAVLDLVGAEEGADAAVGFGILSSLPAAASGLADWSYTSGKARRLGLVHALLNTVALGLYTGSWLARKSDNRAMGVGLSTLGLGAVSVSAYLGGDLSYSLGQGVNRIAFSPDVGETSDDLTQFKVVAKAADLPEGQLSSGEFDAGGEKIPLVLLKRGGQVYALNSVCTHMGGPLAEGKLVGEWCVECPWHGSQFDLRDGHVVQSPAAYPQPRFETRIQNGNVEARLAR